MTKWRINDYPTDGLTKWMTDRLTSTTTTAILFQLIQYIYSSDPQIATLSEADVLNLHVRSAPFHLTSWPSYQGHWLTNWLTDCPIDHWLTVRPTHHSCTRLTRPTDKLTDRLTTSQFNRLLSENLARCNGRKITWKLIYALERKTSVEVYVPSRVVVVTFTSFGARI